VNLAISGALTDMLNLSTGRDQRVYFRLPGAKTPVHARRPAAGHVRAIAVTDYSAKKP